MCGRYYRKSDKQAIAKAFKTRNSLEDVVLPDFDYNIAPSMFQPIIRADAETGERTLALMRWGLVPARIANPDSFKIFTTSNAR
jgi:putative SOS response-associated peptidase YedK